MVMRPFRSVPTTERLRLTNEHIPSFQASFIELRRYLVHQQLCTGYEHVPTWPEHALYRLPELPKEATQIVFVVLCECGESRERLPLIPIQFGRNSPDTPCSFSHFLDVSSLELHDAVRRISYDCVSRIFAETLL